MKALGMPEAGDLKGLAEKALVMAKPPEAISLTLPVPLDVQSYPQLSGHMGLRYHLFIVSIPDGLELGGREQLYGDCDDFGEIYYDACMDMRTHVGQVEWLEAGKAHLLVTCPYFFAKSFNPQWNRLIRDCTAMEVY